MSRWDSFRGSQEDYPETWYEYDVFLCNAIRHIMNRGGDTFLAVQAINDARSRLWDARNGVSILAKIEVAA